MQESTWPNPMTKYKPISSTPWRLLLRNIGFVHILYLIKKSTNTVFRKKRCINDRNKFFFFLSYAYMHHITEVGPCFMNGKVWMNSKTSSWWCSLVSIMVMQNVKWIEQYLKIGINILAWGINDPILFWKQKITVSVKKI